MAWELACPALQAIAMERARRAGNGSGGVECVARNTGKDRRIGGATLCNEVVVERRILATLWQGRSEKESVVKPAHCQRPWIL
jgi:hypothetical protein